MVIIVPVLCCAWCMASSPNSTRQHLATLQVSFEGEELLPESLSSSLLSFFRFVVRMKKPSAEKFWIFIVILLGMLGWMAFWFSYDKKLSDEVKESSNSEVVKDLISEEKRGETDKPEAKPVRKGKYAKRVHLNFTFDAPIPNVELYKPWENVITDSGIYWADFIKVPREKHRSAPQPIDSKALQVLRICSAEVVANLSVKTGGTDWCKWALSQEGGQVKVGESFGKLTEQQKEKFEALNCNSAAKGVTFSCEDERGDNLIQSWRHGKVKDLCESNAESKLQCFDSPWKSRYCIFENAMMNFKRVRQRNRPDGTATRMWEQGFLATSCGLTAPENIRYYPVYKPDVDGSSDALCDFVFNETVIAYSHDNIKSFAHMFSDYLNVWSMMWLSGVAKYSKDISFLNIDSLGGGSFFGDEPNQYFRHYEMTFRRVIKAVDFGRSASVCFRKLIMQPKPEIPFTKDGWKHDLRCSFIGPSSLYQRWNMQTRQAHGLFHVDAMPTVEAMRILLVLRPRKSDTTDTKTTSRMFLNSPELVNALNDLPVDNEDEVIIDVIEQDFSTISYEQQVRIVGSSSIVIGMHGSGIASSVHMPVGTKYCCGVIEIFPDGEFKPIRGYGNMARRMGHYYRRLELVGKDTSSEGTSVPPAQLTAVVMDVISSILKKPSCLLPAVVKRPI